MDKSQITKGSILIAHISDNHLLDTQYATSQRSTDFYEAFRRAIIAACEAGADVIVNSGDIFHVARPSSKVIGQLIRIDNLLKSQNIRMLAVTGNHDYASPTWLETLFPETDVHGIIPIDGKKVFEHGFHITGIPPYTATAFRDKAAEIDLLVRDSDVVVYHGFVTGITPVFTKDANVLDVKDLPSSASIKAILIGDIHVQKYVDVPRPGGGTMLVGYPGSTEMGSASESTEKSIPMIRVTKEGAVIEKLVPLTIRPFIARDVHTEEDLDQLIADVTAVAAQHPVVPIKFNRALTQTVTRLHAALDPQRSVIRCYPLPLDKTFTPRVTSAEGEEDFDMAHFVSARFQDEAELETVALALLDRSDDAVNIIVEFIEKRKASMAVRD